MIYATNPISNIKGLGTNAVSSSVLSLYKTVRNYAKTLSEIVFQSVSMLSNSDGNGITLENLHNLKQRLEKEGYTNSSAYELVETLTDSFEMMSSDGKKISFEDFSSIIMFSSASEFANDSLISQLIKDGRLNVSNDIKSLYGSKIAQLTAFVQLMENLSDHGLYSFAVNAKTVDEKHQLPKSSFSSVEYTV